MKRSEWFGIGSLVVIIVWAIFFLANPYTSKFEILLDAIISGLALAAGGLAVHCYYQKEKEKVMF